MEYRAVPKKVQVTGDPVRGRRYIGRADSELNRLLNQMRFQGLEQGRREVKLAEGVVAVCWKVAGLCGVNIHALPDSKVFVPDKGRRRKITFQAFRITLRIYPSYPVNEDVFAPYWQVDILWDIEGDRRLDWPDGQRYKLDYVPEPQENLEGMEIVPIQGFTLYDSELLHEINGATDPDWENLVARKNCYHSTMTYKNVNLNDSELTLVYTLDNCHASNPDFLYLRDYVLDINRDYTKKTGVVDGGVMDNFSFKNNETRPDWVMGRRSIPGIGYSSFSYLRRAYNSRPLPVNPVPYPDFAVTYDCPDVLEECNRECRNIHVGIWGMVEHFDIISGTLVDGGLRPCGSPEDFILHLCSVGFPAGSNPKVVPVEFDAWEALAHEGWGAPNGSTYWVTKYRAILRGNASAASVELSDLHVYDVPETYAFSPDDIYVVEGPDDYPTYRYARYYVQECLDYIAGQREYYPDFYVENSKRELRSFTSEGDLNTNGFLSFDGELILYVYKEPGLFDELPPVGSIKPDTWQVRLHFVCNAYNLGRRAPDPDNPPDGSPPPETGPQGGEPWYPPADWNYPFKDQVVWRTDFAWEVSKNHWDGALLFELDEYDLHQSLLEGENSVSQMMGAYYAASPYDDETTVFGIVGGLLTGPGKLLLTGHFMKQDKALFESSGPLNQGDVLAGLTGFIRNTLTEELNAAAPLVQALSGPQLPGESHCYNLVTLTHFNQVRITTFAGDKE